MAATNTRLLISESRGNSNRCTPYREKPDQHDTYTSHASPRTPGVCFMWAVHIRGNLSHRSNRVGQIHRSREKVIPTPPPSPTEWSAGPTSVSLPTQLLKQCA
jgi:hypothetical protein